MIIPAYAACEAGRTFNLAALNAKRAAIYQMRARQEVSDETLAKIVSELDVLETLIMDSR